MSGAPIFYEHVRTSWATPEATVPLPATLLTVRTFGHRHAGTLFGGVTVRGPGSLLYGLTDWLGEPLLGLASTCCGRDLFVPSTLTGPQPLPTCVGCNGTDEQVAYLIGRMPAFLTSATLDRECAEHLLAQYYEPLTAVLLADRLVGEARALLEAMREERLKPDPRRTLRDRWHGRSVLELRESRALAAFEHRRAGL